MAMYAFKDIDRKEKLLARNAQKEDRGVRFYCPNQACDAAMYIRSFDGLSAVHFSANRSHSHIKNCPYGSSNDFRPAEHKEDEFSFEDALTAFAIEKRPQAKKKPPGESQKGASKSKSLRTIRQIYFMCKSYDCSDSYNGKTIGQMLVDDRSIYMYPKGVFGWRIIESKRKKPRFYNTEKKEISLVSPLDDGRYGFLLKFTDKELFAGIRNEIYNSGKKIIVAGNWVSSGEYNVFSAEITSKNR